MRPPRAPQQPHLVFFLVDDYGFGDVGYHADMYGRDPDPQAWNQTGGANRMETPNLDRLSAAGVRLENYYIQPVCSPTRATCECCAAAVAQWRGGQVLSIVCGAQCSQAATCSTTASMSPSSTPRAQRCHSTKPQSPSGCNPPATEHT